MWYWPSLTLTDYEREYVRMYKSDEWPGVLRRAYNLQLASEAQPANNIPAPKLIDKYQIGRRSRIFAITFSGNPDCWRLSVSNTNGTQYTIPAPRSQQFPIVTSLVAGSYYNALALSSIPNPINAGPLPGNPVNFTDSIGYSPELNATAFSHFQSFPWMIEPNWVCQPNESIFFTGTPIPPNFVLDGGDGPEEFTMPILLNITVYAWEFPGMGK